MDILLDYICRLSRMGPFQYIKQVSYFSKIMPRYTLQKRPKSATRIMVLGDGLTIL